MKPLAFAADAGELIFIYGFSMAVSLFDLAIDGRPTVAYMPSNRRDNWVSTSSPRPRWRAADSGGDVLALLEGAGLLGLPRSENDIDKVIFLFFGGLLFGFVLLVWSQFNRR